MILSRFTAFSFLYDFLISSQNSVGYIVPILGGSFGAFDAVMYSALAFGLGTFADVSKNTNIKLIGKLLVIASHITAGAFIVMADLTDALFIKEVLTVLGIYASILLISVLQRFGAIARFCDFMNRYSFQTYLLHTIFTAGIRIIFMCLGITNRILHIFAGCIGGIEFSVLSAMIAAKVDILNAWFFPGKAYASFKSKKSNYN